MNSSPVQFDTSRAWFVTSRRRQFLLDRIDDHNRQVQPPPHAPAVRIWDGDSGKRPQPNVSGLSAYRLMLRRSSSIRNAGGRSCWCRSRYSAISSSAFGVGPATTLVKKRRQSEMPRLTAGASREKRKQAWHFPVSPFRRIHPHRGLCLDDVIAITKRSIVRNGPCRCDGRHRCQ